MGLKLKDKMVLQGCREGYCEYGPATGVCVGYIVFYVKSHLTSSSDLMGSKAGSHSGNPWSFPWREEFSILILTFCQKAMGAEVECLILFFGGLGVCYLLVDVWRWHGARSYSGPAETWPNVFGGCNNCMYHSGCRGEFPLQKPWFDSPEKPNIFCPVANRFCSIPECEGSISPASCHEWLPNY